MTRPVVMVEEGGRGGVADYTQCLVDALVAEGAAVELVTASDHSYALPATVRALPWVHYVRGTTPFGRFLRRARLAKIVNGLDRIVVAGRVALLASKARVVHVQGGAFLPATLLLVAGVRLRGAPVVHTPHNTFDRGRSMAGVRRLLSMLATRIIVHVNADLPALPARARHRARVVPHGNYDSLADTPPPVERDTARAELGLAPETHATLMFGQLRRDKGVRDLLEAARVVPAVTVVLAGQELGGLADVRDLLADPALSGRVVVREGFQPLSAAAHLFAAADTAALPYHQASASGVLMLAYGFSRPAVVYPVGGLVEMVISGETGWICDRADPESLARTLAAAADAGPGECLRRGAAAARLAEERYSWPAIARATLAVYDEVAPPGPGAVRADGETGGAGG